MSKLQMTADGLTRSGIWMSGIRCFIAVFIWQRCASKGKYCIGLSDYCRSLFVPCTLSNVQRKGVEMSTLDGCFVLFLTDLTKNA